MLPIHSKATKPGKPAKHSGSQSQRVMNRDHEQDPSATTGSTEIVDSPRPLEPDEGAERKKKRPRPKKPADMPRRPLSAYNLFFKEQRAKLQAGSTKKSKFGFEELGKKIGAMWKEVGADEKKIYQDKAKLEMDRYQKEMELYQSEAAKKARATSNGPPSLATSSLEAMMAAASTPEASSATSTGPVFLNGPLVPKGSEIDQPADTNCIQPAPGLVRHQLYPSTQTAVVFPPFSQHNVQLAQQGFPFMQNSQCSSVDASTAGIGFGSLHDAFATQNPMNIQSQVDPRAHGAPFSSLAHSQHTEQCYLGSSFGHSAVAEANDLHPWVQQSNHEGYLEPQMQVRMPFDGEHSDHFTYSNDVYHHHQHHHSYLHHQQQQFYQRQEHHQHHHHQQQRHQEYIEQQQNPTPHDCAITFVHQDQGLRQNIPAASGMHDGKQDTKRQHSEGQEAAAHEHDYNYATDTHFFDHHSFSTKPPPPSKK